MKNINMVDIICLLFAILFFYAAFNKLLTFDEFQAQIGKSPLITRHGWWIAWFIPSIEIAIAVILFIPRLRLLALYSAFSLMLVFTLYIGFMLMFTPNLPCSCGGILNSMGWKEHLIFNIGFTLLGLVGILLWNRQAKKSLSSNGNKVSQIITTANQ